MLLFIVLYCVVLYCVVLSCGVLFLCCCGANDAMFSNAYPEDQGSALWSRAHHGSLYHGTSGSTTSISAIMRSTTACKTIFWAAFVVAVLFVFFFVFFCCDLWLTSVTLQGDIRQFPDVYGIVVRGGQVYAEGAELGYLGYFFLRLTISSGGGELNESS
jgi:hypothetical protein